MNLQNKQHESWKQREAAAAALRPAVTPAQRAIDFAAYRMLLRKMNRRTA